MAKGLGRGLDAFFGEDTEQVEKVSKNKKVKELEKVIELKISEVEPTLNQPRKIFDEEKLEELAASIKENGVIQPILVVKDEFGYTIVAGERRWRAAKMAGLTAIPAIVKDYTDSRKKQVALIENIQREDLNVIEVATAIKELMEIDGYTNGEVARITGKNTSTVSNLVRLLRLPDEIIQMILEEKLMETHARPLLVLDDKEKQIEIAKQIIAKKLTVREIEKLIYGSEEYEKKRTSRKTPKNVFYVNLEHKLKDYFGYKVQIDQNKRHKRIIIEYNDDEGLQSVLEKFKIKL